MEEDENLFSSSGNEDKESYFQRLREMEKEMMKIDLSRGGVMPLTLEEYTEVFGEPSKLDLYDITQAYIKLYLKQGNDLYIPFVVDAYGKEWVEKLLKYNEEVEEYEICSILKEHLYIYKEETQSTK